VSGTGTQQVFKCQGNDNSVFDFFQEKSIAGWLAGADFV